MHSTAVTQLLRRDTIRKQKPLRKRHEIVCPFCGHAAEESTPDDATTAYCRHVVGFTDDGRWMEARVMRNNALGVPAEYVGGLSRQKVRKTDVVVPGISYTSRVYRRGADAPFNLDADLAEPVDPDAPVELPSNDMSAVLGLMEEQRLLIRELRDELDDLKGRRRPPKPLTEDDLDRESDEAP